MWLSGQRHLCSIMASSLGYPLAAALTSLAHSTSTSLLCLNPLRRHGQQINKTQSAKASVAWARARAVCDSYSYLSLLSCLYPTHSSPLHPPPPAFTSSALSATDKCFVFFKGFAFLSLFFSRCAVCALGHSTERNWLAV